MSKPRTSHGEAGGKKKKPRAKDWQGTLKKLWIQLSLHKRLLWLVILMVILSSALGLLGPYLIGKAIDDYIVTKDEAGLAALLLFLGVVYVLHSLSLWLQNYWMIGIAQDTVFSMRNQLFRHLHELPIYFFDKRQHGELMSRLTNDMENVSQTLNSSVIQVFSSVLTLAGTIAVMLWISPLMTLVTMIIIPLMFVGMKWITNRTGKLFKEQQQNLGEINGFIQETISGQKIVKTFSQEEKMISEFIEKSAKLKKSGYWAQTYSGFIPKLMNMLNNLSFALIAAVGGILALKGSLSIGSIVIFAEYSRQFTRPLNDLSNQFNTLLSAVAGAERVFEILDVNQEKADERNALNLPGIKGEVEFSNVTFEYEKDNTTLEGVDFRVLPGETVAFVGPTGAGKTTIINLITRFYDVTRGAILIDGHDIRTIKRESLRSQMGFVLQDPFLFQGSIRDNIRYGKLDAADEEVEEAAKAANAHSFIMKLPDQYDTLIKAGGGGISQGQKQLLSIARTILSDPSILILDEATSSIDTITELKIQQALYKLMQGRTSFVIAHRLNTIRRADTIMVVQDGKILEKGSHYDLMKAKGFYSSLYETQFKEQSG